MFLMGQIFAYLTLAMCVGAAAGWLLRNIQAQRQQAAASKETTQARARVPQLETLLQQREQQISELQQALQSQRESARVAHSASTNACDPGNGSDLEAPRVAKLSRALQHAQADLQAARQHVGQLERERDLQKRSLQVLHQQLDLERSRRSVDS